MHTGGAGERGADVLVFTENALGLEYKVAVQVKLYDGEHDELGALDQIKTARSAHKVHAGVVVTTAEKTTSRFDERREELEVELGIQIHVIERDELTKLLMRYLGADGL